VTADDRTAIIGDEAAIMQVSRGPQGVATNYAWSEAWSGVERSRVAIALDSAYVRGLTEPLLMESGALELMMLVAPHCADLGRCEKRVARSEHCR
jgi:hypothetical protein